MAASKAPAPAPRTPPPPPLPAKPVKPASSRISRAKPPTDDDQAEQPGTRRTELAKTQKGRGNRRLIIIISGLALLLIAIIALAAAWGPMQRSRQLAAIDACRAPERLEEGRQLAIAFTQEWGPRSEYVVSAIAAGHGSLEARIEMCRAGSHLRLLAQILGDDKLTPAQRGLVCAALSLLWPEDSSGPGVSPSLPAWALNPESEPALAEPALRLLVSLAAPDTEAHLARAAADGRLSAERAVSAAIALGQVVAKRGGGVSGLVVALGGPHRAALLASAPVTVCIRDNALPSDTAKLFGLLAKPDSIALGLAGLGGKRFQISESDTKARAELTAQVQPFLTASTDDAVLAGALLVVHRQRLLGARKEVLALLPRLAKRRPAELPKDDLADLLGKSLVTSKTPESSAAAEEVVTALTEALDKPDTRNLAIVALSRVQDPNITALRIALDSLAGYGDDGGSALEILVSKVYGREDIAKAARSRTWSAVLADDRRKRARYDAIIRWMSDHADETSARTDSAVMAANKTELGRMRDEIRTWQESKDPLALGLSKPKLDELINRVQLMTSMVIKATHSD